MKGRKYPDYDRLPEAGAMVDEARERRGGNLDYATYNATCAIAEASIIIAEAARETRDLIRAILAELQAQRPATVTNEWDPATVAMGEDHTA